MSRQIKYGKQPYTIALIHGGPGVAGYLSPMAETLSSVSGSVEPFLLNDSIEGQLKELFSQLNNTCKFPVSLIGHSWGAWLSMLFTAHFPHLVGKLVLIGSGAFDEKYKTNILRTRLDRLNIEEQSKAMELIARLTEEGPHAGPETLKRFGEMMSKADSFDSAVEGGQVEEYHPEVYYNVWREASEMRRRGELLKAARLIQCPVLAIHGIYDPHPSGGVEYPLKKVLSDFQFVLLDHCGHYPWRERQARDEFYKVLKSFLSE